MNDYLNESVGAILALDAVMNQKIRGMFVNLLDKSDTIVEFAKEIANKHKVYLDELQKYDPKESLKENIESVKEILFLLEEKNIFTNNFLNKARLKNIMFFKEISELQVEFIEATKLIEKVINNIRESFPNELNTFN
jgi:hypothetical protein